MEVWLRRYRVIMFLLWVHAGGIAAFGVIRGYGMRHSVAEASVVGVAALAARWSRLSRPLRAAAATFGLMSASAILVHLSGGYIEMHFHFFVMIGVITLFQDWFPFLLALGYVVLHHGVFGVLDPVSVYNHPAAWKDPWTWALIHGVFVLGASVAYLAAWRLNERGFQDSLTQLPNRSLFEDRVAHALRRGEREGHHVTVLFLDLDDFKTVNDSLGHAAGDRLLVSVANRLRRCVRSADSVARFGGDEFTILLEGADDLQATAVAERILHRLHPAFLLQGREAFVSASIGIASNIDGEDATELLRNADVAMYAAKKHGKGRYEWFLTTMHSGVLDRLELQTQLQRAVDRKEFVLQYQPIVELDTGRIVGAEALVRWNHPDGGLMAPNEFIPLAEETGLIVPIGRWVLVEACRRAREWNARANVAGPLQVSVNLSPRQVQEPDVAQEVAQALQEAGLDPRNLVLEITESVLVGDIESTTRTLQELKGLGVQFAIDDFGTGYSSFAYLQRLPIDTLKIDRQFIRGVARGTDELALARAIVTVGHTLNLKITAEGIESPEQLAELQRMGCDLGQGYLFAKPLGERDISELLIGGLKSFVRPVGDAVRQVSSVP